MRQDGKPVDDFLIIPGVEGHDRGRPFALHWRDIKRCAAVKGTSRSRGLRFDS